MATGVIFVAFGSIDFDLEAFAPVEPAVELADIVEVDFTAAAGTAFFEGSDFPWGFAADFEADLGPAALSTETLTTLPAGDGFDEFCDFLADAFRALAEVSTTLEVALTTFLLTTGAAVDFLDAKSFFTTGIACDLETDFSFAFVAGTGLGTDLVFTNFAFFFVDLPSFVFEFVAKAILLKVEPHRCKGAEKARPGGVVCSMLNFKYAQREGVFLVSFTPLQSKVFTNCDGYRGCSTPKEPKRAFARFSNRTICCEARWLTG